MATDKRRATPQYWEARLKRMGLDADKGRPTWLQYGHDINTLDTDGRRSFIPTSGGIEELAEWPISLY